LNRRFDDQWETTDVVSEIADYGKVHWNGCALDGIIVQTTVAQKNRIKGLFGDRVDLFSYGRRFIRDRWRDVFGEPATS
jgi:hypothetical protein